MGDGEAGRKVHGFGLNARALTQPSHSHNTTRDKNATLDPDCMHHCRFTICLALPFDSNARALALAGIPY